MRITQQRDRRGDADRRVGRQEADERRGAAHQHERDEERVLPADQVADAAEEQRAERPHDEADGERREIRDQRERVVAAADRTAAK